MQILPLTGRNGRTRFALVDPEDYEWALSRRWSYSLAKPPQRFAAARSGTGYAGSRQHRLHREILLRHQYCLDGLVVDHHNGWGLDNRKINLRPGSQGQNARNTRRQNLHRYGKQWVVQIGQKVVGRFDDRDEAAEAYEIAAREAGHVTNKMRAELLAPVIQQLEAWVSEGRLIRHIPDAPLIEDRYRLKIGNQIPV
jgi:hypothetical protein